MSEPLPERQREILRRVVEEYVATGQPVGSKTLVERTGVLVSSSTVRAELAELERRGLLTHPHTSAGRVPTEAGYRIYVDGLLARQETRPAGVLARPGGRARGGRGGAAVDDRGAVAGDAAARPRLGARARGRDRPARRRAPAAAERRDRGRDHLDRRRLEAALHRSPSRSTSGSSTGPATICASALIGTRLRSRLLARAFDEPSLSPQERAFLAAIRGAFDEVEDERQLYVGGAAGLLDDLRAEEIGAYRSLMDALEKRAALLDVLAQSFAVRRPFARVGDELEQSGLHDLALVGATYGLREPDPRRRQPARPAAHGLREGAAHRPGGGARALALRRRGLRDE